MIYWERNDINDMMVDKYYYSYDGALTDYYEMREEFIFEEYNIDTDNWSCKNIPNFTLGGFKIC